MTIRFRVDNLKNMNARLKTFADRLSVTGVSPDDVFATRLVSCELITNVIIHGGEAADFQAEVGGERILITVRADSLKDIRLDGERPSPLAESGRGMYIVRALSGGEVVNGDGVISVVIKRS